MAAAPTWAYVAFLAMLMISFSIMPSAGRLDPVTGDDEPPKERVLGGWGGFGGWGYSGGGHGSWYGGGRGGGVPYQCVPVPNCPCHAHPYTLDSLNDDIGLHHGRQFSPAAAAAAAAGSRATEPVTPDMYKKGGAAEEGSFAALAPDESKLA